MKTGRGMTHVPALIAAAVSLLPSSECVMSVYQQNEIPEGGYNFMFSRYNDGRKTPSRVYFWDQALTGSSYRFDGDGNLVYFKAGSEIYSEVVVDDVDGSVEFSHTTESGKGSNHDEHDKPDYRWEDLSCTQCSMALHDLCGAEGSSAGGGLAKFCDAVDLSDLGQHGAASAKILCDRHVNICAKGFAECGSVCEGDGE